MMTCLTERRQTGMSMIGVIHDVTDDDEEIKLSPFVKKLLWLVRNIPN